MTAALAFAIVSLAAARSDGDGKTVVAVIAGREIEADRFARFVLDEKEHDGAGAEALDQLVQERLVDHEARRRGVRVADADVTARLTELDRGLREQSGGKSGLDEQLAAMKVDRAAFQALLKKSIACERMMAADYALPAGRPVPPEKQSLWFQELRLRDGVRTADLPEGVAAEVGGETIGRTEWGLKLFQTIGTQESDKLFDEFVGVELLLAEGKTLGLEVTAERIAREIEERSQLLRDKLASEGLKSDGVDYRSTLKARGEELDVVTRTDRFRAEILLKDLARARFGQDGFRAFFEERRAEFDRAFGRRVRLSTIFLKAAPQKSAKVLRTWGEASGELDLLKRRLASGSAPLPETFASLARLRSEDESAIRGGDLGFLSLAELEKRSLATTLLDQAQGELVGPVVGTEGVHLLLVTEKRGASPFDEIVGEVEKSARRELLKRLRADKKVERRI